MGSEVETGVSKSTHWGMAQASSSTNGAVAGLTGSKAASNSTEVKSSLSTGESGAHTSKTSKWLTKDSAICATKLWPRKSSSNGSCTQWACAS